MFTTSPQVPGIYLDSVFPKPAPALLTGIPVFLGFTSDYQPPTSMQSEPKPRPLKLALWTQFQTYFGQPLPGGYLAAAVRGFFENGGQVCYILRLTDKSPAALDAGLATLAEFDGFDLVCAPDLAGDLALQQKVLEHCDRMGERFAILDAPNVTAQEELATVLQHRQSLKGTNGALYFPWIQTRFPWQTADGKPQTAVPPCGHIAGSYAQGDQQIGVHKAPANQVLADVLDLSIALTNDDLITLNPESEGAGVNCIRTVVGRGTRIWGVRTLSTDVNWRYINVRRLFLTVRRWVALKLADVAFEPNNFNLWIRIERELTVYLESLTRQGALQGNMPQEAFYVKCDAETNPPERRDTGQVVTEIGLAPTRPNEFIVVRLIHGDTGVSLG
jgi:phage tail sheath protein FI